MAIKIQFDLVNDLQELYLLMYEEGHLLSVKFKKEIQRIEGNTIGLFENILREGQKKRFLEVSIVELLPI